MSHPPGPLLEDRDLTAQERDLIRWMLEHGKPEAVPYLGQLGRARVYSKCRCGCASVDLSVDGKRPTDFRMCILGDFQWKDAQGHLFGAFVFEQDGLLAGLDLWSQDGQATASTLPAAEELTPL
jgi:hypothetical protein